MPATVEYAFSLRDLSPDTLPMGRLADYLAQLATLFGSAEAVHFSHVAEGSAVLVARVDEEAKPAVSTRLRSAPTGNAPAEVARAWRTINGMLADDNTTAAMKLPGGDVIVFPGAPRSEHRVRTVRQQTTVQGRIIRLEGQGDKVWVGIDNEAGVTGRICITADEAADLGALFHRYVRFHGMGRWRRGPGGNWSIEELEVHTFEVLDDEGLDEAVAGARAMVPPGSAERVVEAIRGLRDA